MPDFGVFVGLPTESVAIRAMVGSLVALLAVATLLRTGLRVPRVRTTAVTVPVLAIIAVVVVSWDQLLLPVLMTVTDAKDGLPVPVGQIYVRFAPVGLPLLVGAWGVVTGVRVVRRLLAMSRMRLVAGAGAPSRDFRVQRLVQRLASELRVPAPRAVVVKDCPGGAFVTGIRQPTLVLDSVLLARLDDEELEGLLAHELAHVRRRDNLLAFVVGLVRDAFFFVPGGRWVVRRLCEERELAADQNAVEATRKPGALASGLLKTVDPHEAAHPACAGFAATAAIVKRVEKLVDEGEPPGGARTTFELLAVAASLTLAVSLAVQLPAAIAGQAGQRDALAFLWAWQGTGAVPDVEATAFDVYRGSSAIEPAATTSGRSQAPGQEFGPIVLRGHAVGHERAGESYVSTRAPDGLRIDVELPRSWVATPVVTAPEGVGVYWLQVREAGVR